MMRRQWALTVAMLLAVPAGFLLAEGEAGNGRRPESSEEAEYWLRNLLQYHRFSIQETAAALSLTPSQVRQSCEMLKVDAESPAALSTDKLTVVPFPGGRHPRIGFLDGAVNPQRETKVSVFTPWQPADRSRADFVIVDVPEAIWSNLGLTYLAHTHVPTIWTQRGVELPQLEWARNDDGSYALERTLPNGITYSSRVVSTADHVDMVMTLTNGTDQPLTGLRVQNCVMLKGAEGFNYQTRDNKVMQDPYIACRDENGERWIIVAWKPNHRTWANPPCPCMHSDPIFPDCPPGETKVVRGWLSFFEGADIEAEFRRIDALNWWE